MRRAAIRKGASIALALFAACAWLGCNSLLGNDEPNYVGDAGDGSAGNDVSVEAEAGADDAPHEGEAGSICRFDNAASTFNGGCVFGP